MAQSQRRGVWRTATLTRNASYAANPAYVNTTGAWPSANYVPRSVTVDEDGNPYDQTGYGANEDMVPVSDRTEQRPTFRGMACVVLHTGC
jgi:hypothetical protein